jgi:hypothetical protein
MPAFDPKKHTFTWGNIVATGYGPDAAIDCSYNEDMITFQPSLSGSGAISLNPNTSGKITITLLQSSPTNDLFMALVALYRGPGPIAYAALIKNIYFERAVASAARAWVTKIPDFQLAKEVGVVPWIFETDDLLLTLGGAAVPI